MTQEVQPKSWKVEVTDGSGYAWNALRFAKYADADNWARDLMCRWMAALDYRIVESDDDPTD